MSWLTYYLVGHAVVDGEEKEYVGDGTQDLDTTKLFIGFILYHLLTKSP